MACFGDIHPNASAKIKKAVNGRVIVARLAAMKLLYKSLQVRKQLAGQLLQSTRAIQKIELTLRVCTQRTLSHTLLKLPILYLLTLARLPYQSTSMEDA